MKRAAAIFTSLVLLGAFPGHGSTAEEDLLDKMAALLYQDPQYRQFVCGEQPCTMAAFREGIECRKEVLSHKPLAVGYFIEPKRKAFNFYTGFFVVQGRQFKLQCIYFGSGIGADKRRKHKGFKLVRGTERTSPGSSAFDTFQWNGTNYVKARSRTAVAP